MGPGPPPTSGHLDGVGQMKRRAGVAKIGDTYPRTAGQLLPSACRRYDSRSDISPAGDCGQGILLAGRDKELLPRSDAERFPEQRERRQLGAWRGSFGY